MRSTLVLFFLFYIYIYIYVHRKSILEGNPLEFIPVHGYGASCPLEIKKTWGKGQEGLTTKYVLIREGSRRIGRDAKLREGASAVSYEVVVLVYELVKFPILHRTRSYIYTHAS